jgi:hypothetical protein
MTGNAPFTYNTNLATAFIKSPQPHDQVFEERLDQPGRWNLFLERYYIAKFQTQQQALLIQNTRSRSGHLERSRMIAFSRGLTRIDMDLVSQICPRTILNIELVVEAADEPQADGNVRSAGVDEECSRVPSVIADSPVLRGQSIINDGKVELKEVLSSRKHGTITSDTAGTTRNTPDCTSPHPSKRGIIPRLLQSLRTSGARLSLNISSKKPLRHGRMWMIGTGQQDVILTSVLYLQLVQYQHQHQ